MGGFKDLSLESSTQWIQKILGEAPNIFLKLKSTETFKGLLFIKFSSPADANTAIVKLKDAATKENQTRAQTNRMWVDFEAPIEKRAVKSFLSGFRFQLIEWKFPKECVSFDVDVGILKVEGKDVLKAEIVGDG